MGAGSGSIVVTNYTDEPIDIISIQDNLVAEGDRRKVHTVSPRESYVMFTSKIEAISWEKRK